MVTIETTRDAANQYRSAYIYLLLLIPATILGFWKSYFSILNDPPENMTPLVHVHGALMFLWLLMLIAQAWFIRTNRFGTHRLVGRSSYVIAPLITLLGFATIQHEFSRTLEFARIDVGAFGMVFGFAITWGLAIAYRRQPALHVRFIVSTAFAIATAIVFRIFYSWIPGCDTNDAAMTGNYSVLILLLLILITRDWQMGMKRSPYWVVTAVLGISYLGYWTFANTDGWLAFCEWFGDLL